MNDLLSNISFENIKTADEQFSHHFHDTYTVGITYEGVMKSHYLNNTFDFYKDSVRINNPAEVHGGSSVSWSHANFYPTIEMMQSIYSDIFHENKIPYFSKHIINDPLLFSKLHAFFIPYFTKEDDLKIESNLIDALSYLIINYSSYAKSIDSVYADTRIVKDTYELIQDSLDTNFSLDSLAQNVGLSKYHFLRLFKKEFGLTPHHFIINQRINKAYSLITSGMKISQASLEAGFNDQSHFTRNFKKYYGYTPSMLIK